MNDAADLFGRPDAPSPSPAPRPLMTIPQIRRRLRQLAREHRIPELEELADHTRRRTPIRRAPARSRHISPALAEQVRAYAKANPKASYHEIASAHGINIGRVSEVLAGIRGQG